MSPSIERSVPPELAEHLPPELRELRDLQTAIPALAKDARLLAMVDAAVHEIPTRHDLRLGDAPTLAEALPSEAVPCPAGS